MPSPKRITFPLASREAIAEWILACDQVMPKYPGQWVTTYLPDVSDIGWEHLIESFGTGAFKLLQKEKNTQPIAVSPEAKEQQISWARKVLGRDE